MDIFWWRVQVKGKARSNTTLTGELLPKAAPEKCTPLDIKNHLTHWSPSEHEDEQDDDDDDEEISVSGSDDNLDLDESDQDDDQNEEEQADKRTSKRSYD